MRQCLCADLIIGDSISISDIGPERVRITCFYDLLAVITEDERFGELLNSQDQEKRPENMCEIYDMIENKGIEKGIKKGREEGIKEGREEGIVLGGVRMLCSLVQNNMLTTDRAAEAAGLSVSAFQKRMKEYSQ